jgi:predicted nucleic acid-binding Zn ribbon protein
MFPLAELYPVLSEHYADIPEVQQGIIRIAWNYCVGERIKNVSEPLFFHDGVLRVRVPHPQWQTTLNSMKPEIISKINKYLKKRLLRDVTIEVR